MELKGLKRLSKNSLRETIGYDVIEAPFSSPSRQVSVQVWDVNIKIGRAFEYCSDAHAAVILLDSKASGSPKATSGYVKSLDAVTSEDLPKFVIVVGKSPPTEQERKELLLDLQGEKNLKIATSRLDKWEDIEKTLALATLTVIRSPAWAENKEKDDNKNISLKVVVLGDERRLFWKQSR